MPSTFIRMHNETLSAVAMCIDNPDCSPLRIHTCNTVPTPTGFAEIVSDDFPVFHAGVLPLLLFTQQWQSNYGIVRMMPRCMRPQSNTERQLREKNNEEVCQWIAGFNRSVGA
jgi:hypothetical protein